MTSFRCLAAALGLVAAATAADGAEVKILTAGAIKEVILAVVPALEKETGHKAVVANATVGALVRRIEGGEAFDLVVITPRAVNDLTSKGKLTAGSGVSVARVGIGVVVKDGAPLPDISSVDAFKRALIAAKSVAYIDPASGGSSGIYLTGLFEKFGIAGDIKPKAKLKQGGHVADLIVSGEAELGLHQISEILAVKGAKLVGPLPAEVQNYTTYAAAVGAQAKEPDAARTLVKLLAGPAAEDAIKSRGMERPPS